MKIRKKIAEFIIEVGFRLLPKMKSETYLDDLISGLNVRHLKVIVANEDGSPLNKEVE